MSAKFSLWLLSTLLFVATAFALAKVSTMPCFQRLELSHSSPRCGTHRLDGASTQAHILKRPLHVVSCVLLVS
jgi:hypothetical protein